MVDRTKTAVITGALGGIGAALVEAFVSVGYKVVATDHEEGIDLPEPVSYLSIDLERFVDDVEYAEIARSKTIALIGDQGLDVLINNAAIQILGGVDELSRDEWRRSLDVNLTAPFFLTQALLGSLGKVAGSVINISSIHARLTKKNFVAYATSKAALSGMTRSMAVDLGERIRVNAIEPGAIETPMLVAGFEGRPDLFQELEDCHPQKRIGLPKEIAELALSIADCRFPFLHGECIAIDGGISNRLFDPA